MNNIEERDMHEATTNHAVRHSSVCRRAALLGALTAVVIGRPVAAHEGDYYPEETIPEKALNIIEDSTGGGSTALIYTGIGGLVAAGVLVYLVNMARNRRTATQTTTGQTAPESVSGQDDVDTSLDSSGTGAAD
jgi:hypothetical protein